MDSVSNFSGYNKVPQNVQINRDTHLMKFIFQFLEFLAEVGGEGVDSERTGSILIQERKHSFFGELPFAAEYTSRLDKQKYILITRLVHLGLHESNVSATTNSNLYILYMYFKILNNF